MEAAELSVLLGSPLADTDGESGIREEILDLFPTDDARIEEDGKASLPDFELAPIPEVGCPHADADHVFSPGGFSFDTNEFAFDMERAASIGLFGIDERGGIDGRFFEGGRREPIASVGMDVEGAFELGLGIANGFALRGFFLLFREHHLFGFGIPLMADERGIADENEFAFGDDQRWDGAGLIGGERGIFFRRGNEFCFGHKETKIPDGLTGTVREILK